MASLRIKTQEGEERVFLLQPPEITIGKDDPDQKIFNHIAFKDVTVSRRHARLVYENGTWFVEDLKSKNATYVNGMKIQKVALKHGDRIQIGQNILIFEGEGPHKGKTIPWDMLEKLSKPNLSEVSYDTTVDINYLLLQRLSGLVLEVADLKDFLEKAVDVAQESLRVEKILLFTLAPGTEEPRLTVIRGDGSYDRRLVMDALRRRKIILFPDDPSLPPLPKASSTGESSGSIIVAPLLNEQSCVGVIYLENPYHSHRVQEKDRILLQTLVQQIVAGMERLRLFEKIREEARIRAHLERFFSPQVVELILQEIRTSPGDILPPQRVEGTFLFADIQGFSFLAERLRPQEVAELLRDYFSLMTEVVFSYKGTVDKYIGDCILAVFGVPFPFPDHAEKAVACALEISKKHQQFIAALEEKKRFHIRIGINTGEAVAGYIGSPRRMEYTVLGEAVILAERLQTLADPDQIFMGRTTYERVRNSFPVTALGRMTLKGGKEIEVFRMIPPHGLPSASRSH